MSSRTVKRRVPAVNSMDGAGVRILRSVGNSQFARIDPFLMLDNFSSDNPDDYIAGFPAHPHRGFETVTYMIEGRMRHRDHMGNEGILRSGGVQWMTAGRGVIHEEMPEQEEGLMSGFQLWVNLPASEKMKPAAYQNIEPEEVAEFDAADGVRVRLVAGELADAKGQTQSGPVSGISRQPLFAELQMAPNTKYVLPVPKELSGFVYLFEGGARLPSEALNLAEAAELSEGDQLELESGMGGARLLIVAGRAINEPIAQYGPFVMNTHDEIEQAISDYRANRLTG
jgi:redox-sensitive bicupin YhaK (pirin superfamily)